MIAPSLDLSAVNNKIINEKIEEYSGAARGHRTPEVTSVLLQLVRESFAKIAAYPGRKEAFPRQEERPQPDDFGRAHQEPKT